MDTIFSWKAGETPQLRWIYKKFAESTSGRRFPACAAQEIPSVALLGPE
jgi:hypothetical protein